MSRSVTVPACNFQPWVGPNYADEGLEGLKVLLLGESHYTKTRSPGPSTTRNVIQRYGVEGKPQPTITKAMRAVDPESDRTAETRENFWNSVAFYQFIQDSAGSDPDDTPTDQMWEEAVEPFRSVVSTLEPHAVVVFGKKLWRNLPPGTDTVQREIDDAKTLTMKIYATAGGDGALAGHVTHPRGGMAYAEARPRIDTLLRTARDHLLSS